MSRLSLIVAAALSLTAPAALAYTARNGLQVDPIGPSSFRVPYRGKSGAPDFWCAAGDFAQSRLGLGVTDRIWRLTPVPRRSGEPMAFALSPESAAKKTGLVVLFGRDDGSLSVASALNHCGPVR